MTIKEGQVREYERTFTTEDVRQFTDVSGDAGEHHVERDEEGRLVVQGLLTATLPTKIGGDLNVVARTMTFEFLRPVYTGDAVTCRATAEDIREREDRIEATIDFTCRNQDGDVVLEGQVEGVIFQG